MANLNVVLNNHLLTRLPLLLNRDFLIDIFTISEKLQLIKVSDTEFTVPTDTPSHIYAGKLCEHEGMLYEIISFEKSQGKIEKIEVTSLNIKLVPNERIASPRDLITIHKNQIANYQDDQPLETSLGRLLLNYAILVDPFNDVIPFLNEVWRVNMIERTIWELLLNDVVTTEQVKHYERNVYFIGQFTELSVPIFSKKSLVTSPEVLARKRELLVQYEKELAAGDSVTMTKVESELTALDKDYLKDDVAMGFLGLDPNKSFGIHRKKMLITGGMTERFGSKGEFDFVPNSLSEGWTQQSLSIVANEIRSGSYSRALETAKGGEESKFIMRVFQNTRITEDDCHTTRYLSVTLTKDVVDSYIYRYILLNGELVQLTSKNIDSFMNKTVLMRSPLYCKTENGYCYTCAGELFRKLNQQNIALVALSLSSLFTVLSLKRSHGQSFKIGSITSLNKYLL